VATSTVGGFPSPQPLTLTCGGSLDWRAVATQLLSSAKRRRGGQRPFLSFVAPGTPCESNQLRAIGAALPEYVSQNFSHIASGRDRVLCPAHAPHSVASRITSSCRHALRALAFHPLGQLELEALGQNSIAPGRNAVAIATRCSIVVLWWLHC
jgi:hypothetical protein